MHASSGIRTHNANARAGDGGSCLTPLGHSDRKLHDIKIKHILKLKFLVWKSVSSFLGVSKIATDKISLHVTKDEEYCLLRYDDAA
jgi:hypothetical protein